jgi:hypothetical protein
MGAWIPLPLARWFKGGCILKLPDSAERDGSQFLAVLKIIVCPSMAMMHAYTPSRLMVLPAMEDK